MNLWVSDIKEEDVKEKHSRETKESVNNYLHILLM